MDQEVAKTLGELELKLQELERELTSIGRRDTQALPLHPPGKLIDEAAERGGEGEPRTETVEAVDSDAFGGPAVFGGEEVPAQAGAAVGGNWTVEVRETAYGEIPTPPSPPTAPPSPIPGPPIPPPAPTPQPPPTAPPGPPSPETPPGPPPAPPPQPAPEPQPIDVADLVRFKEKMQRTMEDLIDEYGKLLSSNPPS